MKKLQKKIQIRVLDMLHLLRIRKKSFILILIVIIISLLFLIWPHYRLIDDVDRKLRLKKIDSFIKQHASNLTCKHPKLDVYNPEIMKFIQTDPPIDCSKSGLDWVKCRGSECVIQEAAIKKFGPIECSFTDILRIDDYELTDGSTTDSHEYYKLEKSDVVRAACESAENKWSQTLTGIRLDNEIWDSTGWGETKNTALNFNVLIFGFDSLARNAFIRKLPKTYQYLTQTLGSVILEGYNIIGDGTPQALIPILTGKTELELPDTRKRIKNSNYVNSYPFIWNKYKEFGYVNGFYEDIPNVGTFTYRLNGFKKAPTDHYMRPYYLANLGEQSKWPKLCTGNSPRHKTMLNMIIDFFSVYRTKPKFLFGFHGELSHDDYNLIGVADDDTLNFLKELNTMGVLNNTILIMMADHGHRFAQIRNTLQGKQEERMPFFSFTLPPWFETKYPTEYLNMRSNAKKLTTPFDIHKTLENILDLNNMDDISQPQDHPPRAISLFSEIPNERSCADAYIEPHWCACLDWQKINLTDHFVHRLTSALVDYINNLTKFHRNICEVLNLSELFWIMKLVPNKSLLKFSHNKDVDGFVADLSANLAIKDDLYQIKIALEPGNSIFEASIKHIKDTDRIVLKESDISRINMYRSHAGCVEENLPHLRKFCYCKSSTSRK